jgi:hypothetical protein
MPIKLCEMIDDVSSTAILIIESQRTDQWSCSEYQHQNS